jgi:hypothetical protein
MKKLFLSFVVFFIVITLVGCTAKIDEPSYNEQIYSVYQLAVTNADYQGTYDEWLNSVKGPQGNPGVDGREIILQVSEGYIQWQYNGDSYWENLIDLISLTGANGTSGTDGRDILFQVSDGYIQWQYTGDTTWTSLIALATITGTDGTDGKEVVFQVGEGHIQWQYMGDSTWTNLVDLATLSGASGIDGIDGINGVDGREIVLQIDGDMIQWKYVGDDSWTDLIIYNNVSDGYYLTDDEINFLLQNNATDITSLFPSIDLSSLNNSPYNNICDTEDFEICNTSDNYPMIFGEGYEKFVDKQNATNLLAYVMSAISELMGLYDSEPIVPNNYLSGSDALASVAGRNNTSILFEGNLDGSVPISIPLDLQFTYQLLIYKSLEDNKIYVEGNIEFASGFLFLDFEIAQTSFLSTYSMNLEMDNFVYTTDVVGLAEWVTIMRPTVDGVEIYSTNLDSIEYFSTKSNVLEILYSSNWYETSTNYYYEIYDSSALIYRLIYEAGNTNYEIPFSAISGWDNVEFKNDFILFGENELSYRISFEDTIIKEGLATISHVELEPVWILSYNYRNFYNNLGELDDVNASNVIMLRVNLKSSMLIFLGTELTYSLSTNWDEYLIAQNIIDNYVFYDYQGNLMNIDAVFVKFNLRD